MWVIYRWLGVGMASLSLGLLVQRGIDVGLSDTFQIAVAWYRITMGWVLGWLEPILAPFLDILASVLGLGYLGLYLTDWVILDSFVVLLVTLGGLSRGTTYLPTMQLFLAGWGLAVAVAAAVLTSSIGSFLPVEGGAAWIDTASFFHVDIWIMSPLIFMTGPLIISLLPRSRIDRNDLFEILLPIAAATATTLLIWRLSDRRELLLDTSICILFQVSFLGVLVAALLVAGFWRSARDLASDLDSRWKRWSSAAPTRAALDLIGVVSGATFFVVTNAGLSLIGA